MTGRQELADDDWSAVGMEISFTGKKNIEKEKKVMEGNREMKGGRACGSGFF